VDNNVAESVSINTSTQRSQHNDLKCTVIAYAVAVQKRLCRWNVKWEIL